MECFVAPRRMKTLFKCVSFGAILLWILFGGYVRQDEPAHDPSPVQADRGGALGRHLLSSEEGLGVTSPQCDSLEYKSGRPVNTTNDQVGGW